MERKFAILIVTVLFIFFSIPGQGQDIDQKVTDLLSKMTLEEKIGQLQQYTVDRPDTFKEISTSGRVGSFLNVRNVEVANQLQKWAVQESRLGIPLIFGKDVIHGYRTIYPIPLAEAASWDVVLVEKAAAVAAKEARADGTHWTFAPMVDIARDPRWGRIAEGAGEDTFLGAAMARAKVMGFQGNDLSAPDRVVACAKHFVGYGAAEGGRDYNTTEISERTLREIYLPPFAAAVQAGVGTVMSAFNDLNGIPASANAFTLTQILRREWNFQGFVVSDWNSIGELLPHGIATNEAEAGLKALKAGVDMDMEGKVYRNVLADLIKQGKLDEAEINASVRRILRIKYLLGLFDQPYMDPKLKDKVTLTSENIEIARQLARESIVLLKNQKALLPLRKDIGKIAVVGPLADNQKDLLGTWACMGEAKDVVSVLSGIKNHVDKGTKVLYHPGCGVIEFDEKEVTRAVAMARTSDIIVAVVGESANMSGEASSRACLDLPGKQRDLLQALYETGKPVVAVILSGRPLTISWTAENIPAVLMAWHGGVQAGNAIADVLFGDYNPSGHLPVSVPRTIGQIPLYYNHKNTGRPIANEKYTSKYLDMPSSPLYPFGFGLSYTRFEYANLQLDKTQLAADDKITAQIELTNTGSFPGEEVVQLYIRDLAGSVTRPVKELRGFQRIFLQPGEKRLVAFVLRADELSFYNDQMKKVVEPGVFKIWIGPNSEEGVEGSFAVK